MSRDPSFPQTCRRPILVTGLPRSGTSLTAGVLHLCGAFVGQCVPGKGPANPRGFFENQFLRERVNKPLLRALDADPLGVFPLPDPDVARALPPFPRLRRSILERVAWEGCSHNEAWLFKDAKLTLLFPIWNQLFPRARWVLVRRDKADIIASCLRTPFMAQHSSDPYFWSRWHDQIVQQLEAIKQKANGWWEIRPDDLLAGRMLSWKCMVQELHLTWKEDSVREFLLPEAWQGMPGHHDP